MKAIAKILVAGTALVVMASCSRIATFTTYPFVVMEKTGTVSVKENVGQVVIPVTTYNFEGQTGTVTFKVEDITGHQGEAYTVEPASGVLNFSGNQSQNIVVNVIDRTGTYTGNDSFSISITGTTGDLTMGNAYNIKCNIVDNDIPVDWAYVQGKWEAYDFGDSENKYEIEIKKVDDTTIELTNLWDGGETITGTISFDEANNTADIWFDGFQVVYVHGTYGPIGIFGMTEDGSLDKANNYAVHANVTAAGISIGPWIELILTGDYAYYSLDDGGITTLTKK